jgi:hypothetical protein
MLSPVTEGFPAEIEVQGRSMEPTIAEGTRVRLQRLDADWPLGPGELVLLSTGGHPGLLLHRVIHVFSEQDKKFVIHQGDAPSSRLGVCRREDVVAKAVGVVGDELALPTLSSLDRHDLTRFHRRRIAGRAFAMARNATATLGIRGNPIVQRAADVYRSVASRLIG